MATTPAPTGMTYTNLLTTLRQYVERGGDGDVTVEYQLPYLVNRCERSLADKLKIQGYRYVLTSEVSQQQPVVAKPEGWRNTVSINIGIGPLMNNRRILRARGYEYIRAIYPDDTKLDAPVFYCDYDQNHWLVGPSPDNTYPFEATVYRLPDLLSESNEQNYLTKFVPNMLLYECLKALEPFIKNDSRAGLWKTFADDEFNNVNAQDMAKASDRAQLQEFIVSSYTNVFGGQNINPSSVSYKRYDLTGEDIHLSWPFEALDGSDVAAEKIDVTSTDGITSIWLPDATLVSVGEDILFNNVGSGTVTIRDHDGGTVATVAPGLQWFVYLVANDSPVPGPAGGWETTQFGAGTSSANAAALAGFGLRANLSKLDQNLLGHANPGGLTLGPNARAQVFRNTGGSAIYAIRPAADLGPPPESSNGWFVVVINAGSGSLVITPELGELIDGAASKALAPGESCTVYCFGTGFVTMGFGRAPTSTVSAVIIPIGGPPPANPILLNGTQVGARVQNYTGALTANRVVQYGPTVGYWFVYNNTTGAFTTTFRVDGGDPGVVVPQTNFSILRSDGTNLHIAFTASGGTVTSIATVEDELTGGFPTPITATGTIGLADTAVDPNIYGAADKAVVVEFDQKGRAVNAEELPIAILSAQVSDLGDLLALMVPTGICVPFAAIPGLSPHVDFWLPCNGQLVNKITYARLWNTIGAQYGLDTGTDFVVPDLNGRVVAGTDNGKNRLTTLTINTPNTPGGFGGAETPSLSVVVPNRPVTNVTGTFTGTPGAVTVHGELDGTASAGAGSGAGSQFVAGTDIPVDSTGTFTPAGTWAQTSTGTATGIAVNTTNIAVQPTMVMRYFIKT